MKTDTHGKLSLSLASLTLLILLASLPGEAATWVQGVPLLTARRYHAAVVGGDGKIYVIGGESLAGVTGSVERFDESTQQWEAVAPLPLALAWPAAAKDRNGDIWVFGGGLVATGAQETDGVFKYSIRSNLWSLITQMPETRQGAQAVTDSSGYIYLVCGQSQRTNRNSVRKFDPIALSWSNLPSTQADHSSHAVMIDSSDKIYAIGHGVPAQTIERFDLSRPALGWTFLSPMPSPRQIQGTIGRDGLLYLVGGWTGAYTPAVHRYSPALDSWATHDSLINGRNNMGVVTGVSGRIYSTGGDGPSSTTRPATAVEYTDPYPLADLTILQPPTDQSVGSGTTVTFRVTATGTSQLNYQWQRNGANIPNATAASLTLTSVTANDAASYRIVVSNASGAITSSAAQLVVLPISLVNGLIAYYPFNGNANDESGFGRHGDVHGAVLTTNRFGVPNGAYKFDGSNDYVDASTTINDVVNTFTTSMWFNTTNVHKEDRFANFVIEPSHGQTTWGDASVGAGISAGVDKLKVWEHTHDYRRVVLEYSGTLTGWNFVTLVYSNKVPSLYVNGAFVARGNPSPRDPVRPSNGQKLSARNQRGGFGGGETVGGDGYWFQGLIDDVRIYNRALPSNEIAQLYELERPKPDSLQTGLIAYYPFNENANDESGNGNNGVTHGASLSSNRFGQANSAYEFNGAGDTIVAAIANIPVGASERSLSLWAKAKAPSPPVGALMGLVEWGNTAERQTFGISAQRLSSTTPLVYLAKSYGGGNDVSSAQAADDKWHHLVAIFRNGSLLIFVDGELRGTRAIPINTGFSTTKIGVGVEGGNYFVGSLDDIRIYNRALADAEVSALYQLEAPTVKIGSQPSDAEVKLGQTATFAVEAQGIGTLHYQWRFNGARIIGGTNSILTITGVTALDEGDYTVEVIDDQGSAASKPARLILLRDSDGDGLSDNYEKGVTRYELIQGSFTWREAKADAEARGGHLATITSEAEWQAITAILGRSFEGKGPWLGGTDEITEGSWRWVTGEKWEYTRWAGGEPNNSNDEDYVYFWDDGFWNDHPRLSVHTAYLLEYGYYTDPNNPDTDGDGVPDGVEVDGGSIPTDATSKPLPKITAQPQSIQIPAGQSATLSVTAIGYGVLSYQWFHDGSAISRATNASFNIAFVQHRDAGSYRVVISNIGGSVSSAPVAVTVTPVLELQRLDNGFVVVQVRDQRALAWRIEGSEDLVTWTSLGTASYDAGLGALLDIQATGKARRFYRAVAP